MPTEQFWRGAVYHVLQDILANVRRDGERCRMGQNQEGFAMGFREVNSAPAEADDHGALAFHDMLEAMRKHHVPPRRRSDELSRRSARVAEANAGARLVPDGFSSGRVKDIFPLEQFSSSNSLRVQK